MAITIFLIPKFPLEYLPTSEFFKENLIYKIFFVNVACTFGRARYYTGWTLSEAGSASTGLSYNGKDK